MSGGIIITIFVTLLLAGCSLTGERQPLTGFFPHRNWIAIEPASQFFRPGTLVKVELIDGKPDTRTLCNIDPEHEVYIRSSPTPETQKLEQVSQAGGVRLTKGTIADLNEKLVRFGLDARAARVETVLQQVSNAKLVEMSLDKLFLVKGDLIQREGCKEAFSQYLTVPDVDITSVHQVYQGDVTYVVMFGKGLSGRLELSAMNIIGASLGGAYSGAGTELTIGKGLNYGMLMEPHPRLLRKD